jgi:hypothetical protein
VRRHERPASPSCRSCAFTAIAPTKAGWAAEWRDTFTALHERFLIGSDTWINQRWQQDEALMDDYRAWLGSLPAMLAQRIAWGNGAGLFGLTEPK